MKTLKTINSYLKENGMNKNTQLVKGKGYFYFVGEETIYWKNTSVYVYKLNDLTPERWLQEYKELSNA